ncbi:MAG: hypothetical protein AAFU60_16745, partial [Bacteroidota bacterium]
LNPATAVLPDGPKPNSQDGFKLLNTTPFGVGDDFEDGDISDWTNNLGGNTAAVIGTDPGEGALSLQITGSANNFNNGLDNSTSSVIQPTVISFRVKATNANANHNYVIISDGNYTGASTNNRVIIFFYWSSDNQAWRLVNGQNNQNVPNTFGINTWYLAELRDINYTNLTFDFYLDGALILDDYPFRGNSVTGVDNIQLKNFDGGSGIVGNWDDVQFLFDTGVAINIDDEISCAGDADGGLSAGTENLVGPFTYQWNTGETTASIANLSSGDFSVTVTDVGGASFVASTTLSDPDPLVATTTIDADLTCSGVDDGQITGSATGGTGIYDYLWNTGATDPTIMNLGAGTFVVTVSDANGCFDVASATKVPAPRFIMVGSVAPVFQR